MNAYDWTIQNKAKLPWGKLIRLGVDIYRVESHAPSGYRVARVEGPGCYTKESCILIDSDHRIFMQGELVP